MKKRLSASPYNYKFNSYRRFVVKKLLSFIAALVFSAMLSATFFASALSQETRELIYKVYTDPSSGTDVFFSENGQDYIARCGYDARGDISVTIMRREGDNFITMYNILVERNNPSNIYTSSIIDNRLVMIKLDDETSFRVDGYEAVYPYASYSRMYIYGFPTKLVVYNNVPNNWLTRYADYTWELYNTPGIGYRIIQRHQTDIPDKGWQWDFGNDRFYIADDALVRATDKGAHIVSEEMLPYGFAMYSVKNGVASKLTEEEKKMYAYFGVDEYFRQLGIEKDEPYTTLEEYWDYIMKTKLTAENLSKTKNGEYVVSLEDIRALIPVIRTKTITAKFSTDNNEGLSTVTPANVYIENTNAPYMKWNNAYGETFEVTFDAEISRSTTQFGGTAFGMPENFSYLIINGIEMNGVNGKDAILCYSPTDVQ